MLAKKYTTTQNQQEAVTYRFDYEEWDMIVTINYETRYIQGTAICQINDEAPVYALNYKVDETMSERDSVSYMVGNLALRIARNFALNCLDELEDDEADGV